MKHLCTLALLLTVSSCGTRYLANKAFRHGIKQQQRDIKLLEELKLRNPQWVSRSDTVTVQVHDTITIEKRVVEYKPQPFRDKSREDFLLDSLLSGLTAKLDDLDEEALKDGIRKVFIQVPAWKDFELDTLGIKVKLKNGMVSVDVSEQKISYVKEESRSGLRIEAIRERRWWELWYVWLAWLLLLVILWLAFRSRR